MAELLGGMHDRVGLAWVGGWGAGVGGWMGARMSVGGLGVL